MPASDISSLDLDAPISEFDWPGHSGPLRLRLYRSLASKPALMVFFAPGGFVAPDLDEANNCLRVMADGCGVNILAPYYAEQPDRAFPAPVEDAHVVLTMAAKHRAKLASRSAKLFVGGCEAGGNLAAVSALVCRDRLGPELAGQVLIMPMLDASMGCGSMRCLRTTRSSSSWRRRPKRPTACTCPTRPIGCTRTPARSTRGGWVTWLPR